LRACAHGLGVYSGFSLGLARAHVDHHVAL
jgi:hypothetical protein